MPAKDPHPSTPEGSVDARTWRWSDRWPMLIPILLVGGVLWFSLWVGQRLRQRVKLLDEASRVAFDTPSWGWLEDYLGDDMRLLVGSPTVLRLGNKKPTTDQLEMISGFTELTSFSCVGLTDRNLQSLQNLSQLKHLSLWGVSVSDLGCAVLSRFPKLLDLTIGTDKRLTTGGLAYVGALRHLQRLCIGADGLSDAALEPISRLNRLQHFSLTNAELTGDGLKHLSGLPMLQSVWLEGCEISLAAFSQLQTLPGVRNLILCDSTITDEHLSALGTLPSLRYVLCSNTQVTPAGCEAFAASHPGVMIMDAHSKKYLVKPNSSTTAANIEEIP